MDCCCCCCCCSTQRANLRTPKHEGLYRYGRRCGRHNLLLHRPLIGGMGGGAASPSRVKRATAAAAIQHNAWVSLKWPRKGFNRFQHTYASALGCIYLPLDGWKISDTARLIRLPFAVHVQATKRARRARCDCVFIMNSHEGRSACGFNEGQRRRWTGWNWC